MVDSVLQVLDDYIKMGLFPQCLLSGEATLHSQLPDLDVSEELPPIDDLSIANGNES